MSTFKWTSPIRQGGLSPIPNEVFMEIFKHLRPPDRNPWIDPVYRRDFSRIALVCRFFCSIMLPWIFESMEFTGKNQNGSLNHTPFCRSIIRGCESARTVATFVKRCSFSDWIENEFPPSWYNTEFQILYSKALAFMPNVEELKLTKTSINKYLLKSILGLKCLTSLSLDLSPIQVGAVKAKDIRKLSTLRLKRLRFYENGPYDDGDNTSLISQAICLDSLLVVHTNHWPLVARIAEQNCNLPLQELDIFVAKDVGLLPKIFQKTPALEKLRISMAADLKHVQFGDVLPALDELCCPLLLLRSLVPGRPISSIKIAGSSKPLTETTVSPLASLFKKSTRKIHSLHVPVHDYLTIPFWEHFPDLKLLRLQYVPMYSFCVQKALSDISNAWPHNPPIQELYICTFNDPFFDLELQHKLISTVVSLGFPQIRRISISDDVVWNKVQEDNVWKPSLHLVPLLSVAKRLESGQVDVVDYDGFFEQILSTAEEFW